MRMIHKQQFRLTDYVNLELPRNAKLLAFQEQGGLPTIWYEFPEPNQSNPTFSTVIRRFWIIGTGNSFTEDEDLKYFGTWQFSNGMVWHLYEDVR